MKLSIITINYNNAVGLRKTLESVASQIFSDFEHIVIDGGSTDGSAEIIENYRHVGKWVSEKDNGIYNAMNKGIRMAEGDYCLFLNSGDYLKGNAVLEQVFSYSFDEDIVCCADYIDMGKDSHISYPPKDVTLYSFINGCLNHSGAGFIKRSLFEKYGYYDETMKISADWKFYLIALGLGDATYRSLPIVTAVYDIHGVSATQKELQNYEHQITLKALIRERELKDYMEHARLEVQLREQAENIRSSKTYQVGSAVLKPIKWLIRK